MKLISKELKGFYGTLWFSFGVLAVWGSFNTKDDRAAVLICSLLMLVCILFSRYVLGLPFTSSPILYLSILGLFHLGLVLPWALGLYDVTRMVSSGLQGFSSALTLLTLATACYQVGMLLALRSPRLSQSAKVVSRQWIEHTGLFHAGIVLYVIGIGMFLGGLLGLDPGGFLSVSYSESYRLRAESDPRFFGTGITLVAIALSIAAAGATRRKLKYLYLCTFLWVLGLFYIGFRGPALIAGLIVVAVLLKKGVKIPFPAVIATGVLVLFAIPLFRFAREEPLAKRATEAQLSEVHWLDGPAEMGGSIRPLVETYTILDPRDFRYGTTYFNAILTIMPNLSTEWKPTNIQSIDDLPPNHWITALVDPWAFGHHGGIGFSAVAEPYMNFGHVGVAVYFLALGFFVVWLEATAIRGAFALAAWALILGPLLWTTRNDFTNFVRPAVWGLAYLWASRWMITFFKTLFDPERGKTQVRLRHSSSAKGALDTKA